MPVSWNNFHLYLRGCFIAIKKLYDSIHIFRSNQVKKKVFVNQELCFSKYLLHCKFIVCKFVSTPEIFANITFKKT